jgi:hypothetical protein
MGQSARATIDEQIRKEQMSATRFIELPFGYVRFDV